MLVPLPRHLRTKHENHEKGGGSDPSVSLFVSLAHFLALARSRSFLFVARNQRAARCTCSLPRSCTSHVGWRCERKGTSCPCCARSVVSSFFSASPFPLFSPFSPDLGHTVDSRLCRSCRSVAALSIPAIGASIELSLNVASSFSPTADETRGGGPLRAGFVACGRSSPFYSPGNRRLIIFRYVQFRRRSLNRATATGGSSVSRDSRERNRRADIHRSSALGPRGYGT